MRVRHRHADMSSDLPKTYRYMRQSQKLNSGSVVQGHLLLVTLPKKQTIGWDFVRGNSSSPRFEEASKQIEL